MLSIWDKGAPPPCPAPFNMAQFVLRHAARLSDTPALCVVGADTPIDWTYGALETSVRRLASGLLAQGLEPGDRVILRLGNTVDFPIAYLACLAAGLVAVPTSALLTDHEVDGIYQQLTPSLVLADQDINCGTPPCPVLPLDQLRILMRSAPLADYHIGHPDRLAYIVFTSGTSGKSRAVMHAHRAIWARQMMLNDWYDLKPQDRLLHAGAFNWTFTMGTGLMDPWSVGATSMILQPGTEITDIPDILAASQATIFAAVPGVYRKILRHSTPTPLPNLRHALSAGEKLSETLRCDWKTQTGTDIFEAFGMSECSTFISHKPDNRADEGALGRPQTGRRVAIVGTDGPVPMGDVGQIAVYQDDPGLMLGYDLAPQDSADRFQGSWFLTGDLGHMEPNGSVFYEGRADDMMNAGGFRVSPLEVEHALATAPGVLQIGATEVSVTSDARVIAAFYVADDTVDPATLESFAKDRLPGYKQPRIYEKVAQLPTNANGKLDRKRLRAEYEARTHGSD